MRNEICAAVQAGYHSLVLEGITKYLSKPEGGSVYSLRTSKVNRRY